MNLRRRRFVEAYMGECHGNATQAAITAGYSAKTAKSIGSELLTFPDVSAAIEELRAQMEREGVADALEVMRYLTRVVRGEETEEVITTVGCGEGVSEVERVRKELNAKERIRAAELIGKRYGIFSDRMAVDVSVPVIVDDVDA